MKKFLRGAAVMCAVISLASGFSVSSARADDSVELVRTAQLRLADLGYYSGHADGKIGPMTKDALIAFQRNDGLPINGQLTPETYSRLSVSAYAAYPTRYAGAYYPVTYGARIVAPVSPTLWDSGYVHAQWLASRFASIDIVASGSQAQRDYVVRLNGRGVLFANNQPYLLQASQTFAVSDDEDAIIFTARQGGGACANRNYLLTVHRDGAFEMPREIGNCSGQYEAHVAGNALLVSFPTASLTGGWQSWAMWRYENGALVRV